MKTVIRELHGVKYLHDTALWLQGARAMLRQAYADGFMFGEKGQDAGVYAKALFDLLMSDEKAVYQYSGNGGFSYYDHERDKKGKLTRCKCKITGR